MGNTLTPQCELAVNHWKNLAMWRNLWTILLFIFGAAVVLFLCAVIILFIKESWVGGAVTTVGTIASGTAMNWVVSRRSEAVKEETEAYKDVESQCAVIPPSGVKGLTAPEPALNPEVKKLADEFIGRHKIFFKTIR